MRKGKKPLPTIKAQKLKYIKHITRNNQRYQTLQPILQGKFEGKGIVGRRKLCWLNNLLE